MWRDRGEDIGLFLRLMKIVCVGGPWKGHHTGPVGTLAAGYLSQARQFSTALRERDCVQRGLLLLALHMLGRGYHGCCRLMNSLTSSRASEKKELPFVSSTHIF